MHVGSLSSRQIHHLPSPTCAKLKHANRHQGYVNRGYMYVLILFDVNLFLHTLHSENIEEIDRIKQFLDEIPKVNTYIRVHLIVKGCT